MNGIYNSNWRQIRRSVKPRIDSISISISYLGWDVTLEPCVHTMHSLVSPIRVANSGCMYVSLSNGAVCGDKTIVLSSKNSSCCLSAGRVINLCQYVTKL